MRNDNYYSSQDYKNKIKASGEFRKANDYDVFGWNICMECHYFQADKDAGSACHGECSLMAAQGAYNGVMATAVCNQYINKTNGYKLDGEVAMPELHTEALRRANSCLPGTMGDMQLVKKLQKTRTDKKTGRVYVIA
jgi:hypothetical protein